MTVPPLEHRTLPHLLESGAAADPDATFLDDPDGSLTRAQVLEAAMALAGGLASLGVGRGDRVATLVSNRRELLVTWFAASLLGAVEVPLGPGEVGARLEHQLGHAGASVVVAEAAGVEALAALGAGAGALDRLGHVVVVGDAPRPALPSTPWGELAGHRPPPARPDLGPADPAAILYTSGSTGPAKGVVVSHGHHVTNGTQPTGLLGIGPADAVHVCLPLHHNMAQGYGVLVALVSGARLCLRPRFSAGGFWAEVAAAGATVLPFVGAMLAILAAQAPEPGDRRHRLRVGYGVPVPAALHEPFEERFGFEVVHCYGSTEATIVTWATSPGRVVGSCGRPVTGYEVAVLDELDRPVPAGEVGQICVRPRQPWSMFSGYHDDPAATARSWRNLWFHSGDRGWLDEGGHLWFSDRAADVIRRRGESISSHDVEEAVAAHPGVRLAAAFGVPSELIEEEVMVAVVADPAAGLRPDDLRAWCRSHLPAHAVPRYIDLVEDLPMTTTRKVEKWRLRERGVTASTDDGALAPSGRRGRP